MGLFGEGVELRTPSVAGRWGARARCDRASLAQEESRCPARRKAPALRPIRERDELFES